MQKERPLKPFTGDRHRLFRRDIATAFRVMRAQRDGKEPSPPRDDDKISRALIFGLSGDTSQLSFDDFAAEYNTINGTGEGSLFHLVMTLHSNGFGFYSSSEAAISAELASVYEPVTRDLFSVTNWSEFTFDGIIARLKMVPRTNGGKSTAFTPELVTKEWLALLYGHPNLSKLPANEANNLSSLAVWLTSRYDSWKSFQGDTVEALRCISEWITATFNRPSPDLAAFYEGLPDRPKEIAKAPIAYIGSPRLQGAPDLVPHRVVAMLLGQLQQEGADFDAAGRKLSTILVTANNNALNWIFGLGLLYLKNTSAPEIAKAFQVPAKDLSAVEAVRAAALAIPAPRLFELVHYADYRGTVGGQVSSWASNYVNRLKAWRDSIDAQPVEWFALPTSLKEPFAQNLCSGTDFDAESLQSSLLDLHDLGLFVRKTALPRAMGLQPRVEDNDFQTIQRYIDLQSFITTRLDILASRIEAEIYLAEQAKDATRRGLFEQCRFYESSNVTEEGETSVKRKYPGWMLPLDKIPSFSGGVPDIDKEIRGIESRFNSLLDARTAHLTELNTWLKEQRLSYDPVSTLTREESVKLERAGRNKAGDATLPGIQARRRILSLFLNRLRQCHEAILRPIGEKLIQTGVVDQPTLNVFLYNQKRVHFYVSVFSRTKHPACPLNEEVLNSVNWLKWIIEQVQFAWQVATDRPDRDIIASAIRLERAAIMIRMHGLPEVEYPVDLARPRIELDLPAGTQISLSQPRVKADTVARIFNTYYSALNAALVPLIRPSFFVRTRFTMAGANNLIYAPRQRPWRIPEGWVASGSTSPLRALAEETLGLSADQRDVDVSASIAQLLAEPPTESVREYLRQAPHEWRVALGMPAGKAVPGYKVDKSFKKPGAEVGRQVTPFSLALEGERRYVSILDHGLLTDNRFEWGDVTLSVEQVWDQEPDLVHGRFVIKTLNSRLRFTLTVPIAERPSSEITIPDTVNGFWDRVVAIDLGERSIGYAVYHARTGNLIDVPEAPIPAPQIANLATLAKRHKRTVAPMQKFSSTYDRRMEKARKDAVGTLVRMINELCSRYRAFPLLESIVDSQSIDPQVSQALQDVMKHFLYSSVSERQKFRERFWYNASSMTHPYLKVKKIDISTNGKGKSKEKTTVGPLNLFPGTSIGPKGTSQRDSHCGRNVFDLLDQVKGNVAFTSRNGILQLPDGTELYLEGVGKGGQFLPIKDGTYNFNELKQLIRLSMRRPQPGSRGKKKRDTTISWYKCVFSDCRHEHHADQNAAVNIGWKFFDTKVVKSA